MIRFNNRLSSIPLISACALLLATSSCTKNSSVKNENTAPVPGTVSGGASVLVNSDKTKLNLLFSALRSTPEHMTMTAGTQKALITKAGTRLVFYPYSFMDGTGAPITSGTIDIDIVEMYTPGALIANRVSTSSSSVALKNGGQVYITATQGGVPVVPFSYGIGFVRGTASTEPMELYYGSNINEDSVAMLGAPGSVIGTNVTATIFDTTVIETGVSGSYLYAYKNHFMFDSARAFGWVGSAHLPTLAAPLCNVDVVVPSSDFNSSNTEVFIVFDTLNSAMLWNSYAPIPHAFSSSYKVTVGMDIKVVVISNINGTYYYYEHPYTVINAPSMKITATMTPQNTAYIKSRLFSLD